MIVDIVVSLVGLLSLVNLFFIKRVYDVLGELRKGILSLEERTTKTLDVAKTTQDNLKLVSENAALKLKQKEYRQMFGAVLEVLQEDTRWIRSSFFQRFGSVPEYQELNSQITSFDNKINAVKETLREYRMIETYED